MKAKTAVVVVICVLVAAQIIYSVRRKDAPAPAPAAADVVEFVPAAVAESVPPAAPKELPVAEPGDIESVRLTRIDGEMLVGLSRSASGWVVDNLHAAPAESGRVEAFLELLLKGDRTPVPEAGGLPTGLGEGEGIVVRLRDATRGELSEIILGLRPEGEYEGVYATTPGGGVTVISGDVRGEIGLWRNESRVYPQAGGWLLTRVMSFSPADVTAVEAVYPDHRVYFQKYENGEWFLTTKAPGDAWSPSGLVQWLDTLSDFRIVDVADSDERSAYGLDAPSHRLTLTLADGSMKTVAASPNGTGEGMWVETSDQPGRVYLLPDWRFQLYFQRMDTIFPSAHPSYQVSDIRFIDIRRGGESVKLSRRYGGWRAVAQSYPVKADRLERMARLLAGWCPEDYAEVGERTARPNYGGPLLEVTLADGEVFQYRLGGRHPVFPWRYVLFDGETLFSAAAAEAWVMFPEFVDVMDLGMVFPDFDANQLERVEIVPPDGGDALMTFRMDGEGGWEAETERGKIRLDDMEVERAAYSLLNWKVGGFSTGGGAPDRKAILRLRISGGGENREITVFSLPGSKPEEGKETGGLSFLGGADKFLELEFSDYMPWSLAVRGIGGKIAAAAKTPEDTEEPESVDSVTPAENAESAVPEVDVTKVSDGESSAIGGVEPSEKPAADDSAVAGAETDEAVGTDAAVSPQTAEEEASEPSGADAADDAGAPVVDTEPEEDGGAESPVMVN